MGHGKAAQEVISGLAPCAHGAGEEIAGAIDGDHE